jgi:hypothetical protein
MLKDLCLLSQPRQYHPATVNKGDETASAPSSALAANEEKTVHDVAAETEAKI